MTEKGRVMGELRSQDVPVQGSDAVRTGSDEPTLRQVVLTLCSLCLSGAGGECHVPGCALYLNRAPDIPVNAAVVPADDFVLALGDEMELSAYQQYANGTVQLTLKRKASS